MLFLSPSIVLSLGTSSDLRFPLILWDNLVTRSGITASHEDAHYPATNLANPQTSSLWKSGSTAAQTLVFDVSSDSTIDCVGIARHNWGSGGVSVVIEGITAEPGAVWEILVSLTPGDDAPIIAVFDADYYVQIRLSLTPVSVAPQAAVVYIGTSLRLNKGITPGFAPPSDALQTDLLAGIAENGDFLGDIIVSQRRSASVALRPLDGDWYRDNIRPFFEARVPFFFSWSPTDYPLEASFAKFLGNPQAVMNAANRKFEVSFQIAGLAL